MIESRRFLTTSVSFLFSTVKFLFQKQLFSLDNYFKINGFNR